MERHLTLRSRVAVSPGGIVLRLNFDSVTPSNGVFELQRNRRGADVAQDELLRHFGIERRQGEFAHSIVSDDGGVLRQSRGWHQSLAGVTFFQDAAFDVLRQATVNNNSAVVVQGG